MEVKDCVNLLLNSLKTSSINVNEHYLHDILLKHLNNKFIKRILPKIYSLPSSDQDFSISKGMVSISNINLNLNDVESLAKELRPWRKGPFAINEFFIDSEWQCQLKFERMLKSISFEDKSVLDVGCGNGYFLYQYLNAGAGNVCGLDPHIQYFLQFLFINKLTKYLPIHFLPIGWQDLTSFNSFFDITCCMGVLYHQKNPIECLKMLKNTINSGGELVLETLVIESDQDYCLCPKDRYACMKNVYYIPSCSVVETWLTQAGFMDIECLDMNYTTSDEQRSSSWASDYSLINFLNTDQSLTVEGYQAPLRAIFRAVKK